MYAFHLPKVYSSNLMNFFILLYAFVDFMFFMCNCDDNEFLAEKIEHGGVHILSNVFFFSNFVPTPPLHNAIYKIFQSNLILP